MGPDRYVRTRDAVGSTNDDNKHENAVIPLDSKFFYFFAAAIIKTEKNKYYRILFFIFYLFAAFYITQPTNYSFILIVV